MLCSALFEIEDNTCSNLQFSNNVLQTGQKETDKAEALPGQQFFYDFETEIKYSVDQGENIKGLMAHDLRSKALNVNFDITKRGSLQLCLLTLTDAPKPEKILVKYEGICQEFLISWNEWGWAPLTLLKEYDTDRKVDFEIMASGQNTTLKIAKVYLRYQNIGHTD